MKKLICTPAIAIILITGPCWASQGGDIQFFGNVTEVTCDVTPEINGSVTDLVQLGTVKTNTPGDKVNLVIKATSTAAGSCNQLSGKTAYIAWSGNLNTNGLGAQGGAAQDAYVILKPVNGTDDNPITSADYVADFDATKATTDGFKFTAQLQGGNTPGDFKSAAAYVVTYQ
ncbi:fimbrial protein [Escherichia coli]|nr:fimbrial protein [Escherichia coli]